jgi:hypothetical protein
MVLIAHSMGGLLAKSTIADTDTRLWDSVFLVPPEELHGSPWVIAQLHRMLVLRPKPYVHRVIFISVPHRGSEFADSTVGKLGSSLVRLPDELKGTMRHVVAENGDAVAPKMRKILERGGPTSIRALSPSHTLIREFAEVPLNPGIPFHTILGDRGMPDADPVSDGVVTYESAHLAGAASELVLPVGHNAYEAARARREIERILREHLEQSPWARDREPRLDVSHP